MSIVVVAVAVAAVAGAAVFLIPGDSPDDPVDVRYYVMDTVSDGTLICITETHAGFVADIHVGDADVGDVSFSEKGVFLVGYDDFILKSADSDVNIVEVQSEARYNPFVTIHRDTLSTGGGDLVPDEGRVFAKVSVAVINDSLDTPLSLDPSVIGWTLEVDGTAYPVDSEATLALQPVAPSVAEDTREVGIVVFQVPVGTDPDDVTVHHGFTGAALTRDRSVNLPMPGYIHIDQLDVPTLSRMGLEALPDAFDDWWGQNSIFHPGKNFETFPDRRDAIVDGDASEGHVATTLTGAYLRDAGSGDIVYLLVEDGYIGIPDQPSGWAVKNTSRTIMSWVCDIDSIDGPDYYTETLFDVRMHLLSEGYDGTWSASQFSIQNRPQAEGGYIFYVKGTVSCQTDSGTEHFIVGCSIGTVNGRTVIGQLFLNAADEPGTMDNPDGESVFIVNDPEAMQSLRMYGTR